MSGYEELIGTNTPEPQAETPAVEAVVEPVVSEPAPSEVQAPVETPEAAAPPAQAEPQDPMAPVKAILDERDRRQAAERRAQAVERELQQFRAREAEQQRKAREASEQMPHPLDDPDGFANWLLRQQQTAVQREVGSLSTRHQQQVEVISKNMMLRHLGPEKFGELDKFIQAAPDQAHAIAMKQPDPYGWFHEKFEQAQKARKAEAAAKQLEQFGDKSIEEIVAERVAAALAAQTQAATPAPAAPAVDTRVRNPDGTFAPSTNQTQRHQPPSLSVVAAATAPRGEEGRGGYDALFKRG